MLIKLYKLDPAHYFTSPGLSWDAMLKFTNVKLELLTDIDMLHFFKNSIRGGICHCSVRKAVANNKFIPEYDKTKPNLFIMYLDATNLYGHSMSQFLPISDFQWMDRKEIECLNIKQISKDAEYGYVFEVDMEYPTHLHDNHNKLPLLAENVYPPNSNKKKLICNLNDKKKYIIHYRNQQQSIANGLNLIKIHGAVKIKQSNFLKPYID